MLTSEYRLSVYPLDFVFLRGLALWDEVRGKAEGHLASPLMTKTPKRPRELNQGAKRMVDIATSEMSDREPTPPTSG